MHDDKSIDFLREKYQDIAPQRQDRKKQKKSFRLAVFLIIFTIIGGLFTSYSLYAEPSSQGEVTLFDPIRRLLEADDRSLSGEDDDRINILLLGVGGAGHEGAELADTIILGSLQPSTNKVSMLSFPRDLSVPTDEYGWVKINSLNAYAEQAKSGSGPEYMASVLEDLFNTKIDYYAKIDFSGFEKLIDAIGGVNVYVERTFTDSSFPTDDFLTQEITFEQGWQAMDGETALQFARSRKGNNGEGTDFARAARQQKVVTAAKDKVFSASTLLNPAKVNQLAQLFNRYVDTNMSVLNMVSLAKYAPEISTDNIKSFVLDNSPSSPLYDAYINDAYVLLPKKNDWSDIQFLIANMFSDEEIKFVTEKSLTPPSSSVSLSVQNGTLIPGLAGEAASVLESSGFNVEEVDNASSQDYEKTQIIDYTEGKKSLELAALEEYFDAEVQQSLEGFANDPEQLPSRITENLPKQSIEVDFLVILGQNARSILRK